MARADGDDNGGGDGPSWTAVLLVGMVAGVSLGAVMAMLLRERAETQRQLGGAMGIFNGPPINIYNMGVGGGGVAPQPQLAQAQAYAQRYLGDGS